MQDGICWISESVPNSNRASVLESEITLVVEGRGRDSEASGVRLPDDGAGAIEEAEIAVRLELK